MNTEHGIINLTQHSATADQHDVLPDNMHTVYFPDPDGSYTDTIEWNREDVKGLLTFDELPNRVIVRRVASMLAIYAKAVSKMTGAVHVMIGGAPFLMPHLESALESQGLKPVYAFSTRESVETVNADGSVTKRNVFRHKGWVRGYSL